MSKKLPERVWIQFANETGVVSGASFQRAALHDNEWETIGRYRLERGNEAARVLNYLNNHGLLAVVTKNCRAYLAKDATKSGIRVRWDAKKGKFA
ncbi:MAG: hypothetical protein PHX05_00010 [Acidobacteriota bacterium]|nr:hypothetical protein [Acidobacteriota bacterium]